MNECSVLEITLHWTLPPHSQLCLVNCWQFQELFIRSSLWFWLVTRHGIQMLIGHCDTFFKDDWTDWSADLQNCVLIGQLIFNTLFWLVSWSSILWSDWSANLQYYDLIGQNSSSDWYLSTPHWRLVGLSSFSGTLLSADLLLLVMLRLGDSEQHWIPMSLTSTILRPSSWPHRSPPDSWPGLLVQGEPGERGPPLNLPPVGVAGHISSVSRPESVCMVSWCWSRAPSPLSSLQ